MENETPEASGKKGDHLVGDYYVLFNEMYKEQIKELVKQGKSEEEAEKEAPLIRQAQDMLDQVGTRRQGSTGVVEKMNGWVYEGFDRTYRYGCIF